MKLKSKQELSAKIKDILPEKAQDIYIEAFNKAWDQFEAESELGEQEREAVAHRDAWAAVKRDYVHDEERQIWYPKGEEPEETEEEGLIDSIKKIV